MGFFKDASESLFKYSEKLVNKTEEYAKIAKLSMDIKRFESSIEKIYMEIGEYVKKKIDQGESTLNTSDQFLSEKSASIEEIKKNIDEKRKEIAAIRKAQPSSNVQTESKTDTKTDSETDTKI
jgi:hypothetical protein